MWKFHNFNGVTFLLVQNRCRCYGRTYGNVLYTILRCCLDTSFQTKVPLFCFQAEFQRLALGFKCDMFTLEKRLRLEERSRDLAEENVRKEVSSCQGLLQVCVQLLSAHSFFSLLLKYHNIGSCDNSVSKWSRGLLHKHSVIEVAIYCVIIGFTE